MTNEQHDDPSKELGRIPTVVDRVSNWIARISIPQASSAYAFLALSVANGIAAMALSLTVNQYVVSAFLADGLISALMGAGVLSWG